MKKIITFFKFTLLGGLLVLLPILLSILLLKETIQLVVGLATPIAGLFPKGLFANPNYHVPLAILLITGLSFLIGIAMRSKTASRLGSWVSAETVERLPIYRFVKALASGLIGAEKGGNFKPALLKAGEGQKEIVYVVEEVDADHDAVLYPHAPSGFAGPIKIVPKNQILFLDSTLGNTSLVINHMGLGAGELLRSKKPLKTDLPACQMKQPGRIAKPSGKVEKQSMRKIEQRSMMLAKWANLTMAAAGIIAAMGSHASALMLDGLFSGVNFIAAVMASRVAASIEREPNTLRPFGYEIDEAMYVMFRSLVLCGVILVAGFGATGKIIDYLNGATMVPINLNWVGIYMVFMVVICSSMALWHHRNWIKTEKKSDLLKTERGASIIDGVLSSAAGAAFMGIALLEGTALSFLVPISDAIVVLCLTLYMLPRPIRSFIGAVKEVIGESAGPETLAQWRTVIDEALAAKPFKLIEVAVTKMGRAYFSVAYIRPEKAESVQDLDAIRTEVSRACRAIHEPSRIEIIFTGTCPYES